MDQLPRLGKRELICLLLFTFCLERFPLPLGAWDGLCYFIVALPEPSIYNYFSLLFHNVDQHAHEHIFLLFFFYVYFFSR